MAGIAASHTGALTPASSPWTFVGTVTWDAAIDAAVLPDNEPVVLRLAFTTLGLTGATIAFTTTQIDRGQDRGERRRCGDAEHRDRSRHRSSAHPRPRSSEIHLDRVHHRPAPLLAPGRRYITTFIQQSGDRAHQEADLWTR